MDTSLVAALRQRLSASGYFWLQVASGALALIAAGWIFGSLAEGVVDGEPLTVLDARLALWLHLHAIGPLTEVMLGISAMNGIAGISALSVLLALYFAWQREWYWLLWLTLASPGGMLVNVMMKFAFHRQRPSFVDPILTLTSYSFPSWHTAAATMYYGTLAAYLMPRLKTAGQRTLVLAVAMAIVVSVAFSRIYLGAHYLSDVLAGFAEGIAWLAVCMVAVATLRKRHLGLSAGAHAQKTARR
ncbi:MAG: phosphatase PAP2 family protein [Betaproteobacteria bacterium]